MERAVKYLWIMSIVSAPFLTLAVYVPTHYTHYIGVKNRRTVDMVAISNEHGGELAAAPICLSVIFLAFAVARRNRHVGCAQITVGAGCLAIVAMRFGALDPDLPHVYLAIYAVLAIQILSGWTKAVGWSERRAGEAEA